MRRIPRAAFLLFVFAATVCFGSPVHAAQEPSSPPLAPGGSEPVVRVVPPVAPPAPAVPKRPLVSAPAAKPVFVPVVAPAPAPPPAADKTPATAKTPRTVFMRPSPAPAPARRKPTPLPQAVARPSLPVSKKETGGTSIAAAARAAEAGTRIGGVPAAAPALPVPATAPVPVVSALPAPPPPTTYDTRPSSFSYRPDATPWWRLLGRFVFATLVSVGCVWVFLRVVKKRGWEGILNAWGSKWTPPATAPISPAKRMADVPGEEVPVAARPAAGFAAYLQNAANGAKTPFATSGEKNTVVARV